MDLGGISVTYREMRQKKREMDAEEARVFLRDARVGRLAMSLGDNPYVVPVNFIYFKDKIYFHCSREGQKIDYLSANSRVCFEVDELLGVRTGNKLCDCGSKYRSVIAYGRAEFVENVYEKELALRRLVQKYAGDFNAPLDEKILERTLVVAVNVERLTGKKSV